MFGAGLAGGSLVFLDISMRSLSATQDTREHWVIWLLLLGAVLHPRVCRKCQSIQIVPLDSPMGQRLSPPQ